MTDLIIVRHGDYDEKGRISSDGVQQMKNLVPAILTWVTPQRKKDILLLSSPAPRAEDSAKVLAEGLDLPYETDESLWSDKNHAYDCDRLLDFIEKKCNEKSESCVVILVTHIEYIHFLPRATAKRARKQSFNTPFEIEKGEMLILLVKMGGFQYIRRKK